jgi:hypothetical protein
MLDFDRPGFLPEPECECHTEHLGVCTADTDRPRV